MTKRRLQVEHRFGAYWDRATDNLVSELVDRRTESEENRRLFGEEEEEQAAGCKLEELDSELSNVVLCEIQGRGLCDPCAQSLSNKVKNSVDKSELDDGTIGVCK